MERAFSAMRLPESVREGNVECSGPIMICQKTLPAVGLPSSCLLSSHWLEKEHEQCGLRANVVC